MVQIGELWPNDEPKNHKEQTLLTVPNELKQDLISQGYQHMALSFWVSRLSDDQAAKLPLQFSSGNILPKYFMTSLHDDELGLRQHDMIMRNNHAVFLRAVKKRRVEGRYLFLGAAFRSNDQMTDAWSTIDELVAQIRLIAGLGAAADEVYKVTDHLLSDQFTFNHGPWVIRHHYLDGPHSDCSWVGDEQDFAFTKFKVSPEAQRLFNLAVTQEDASTRFLLLWLALEAQVGRGPHIKQFFQKRVGSRVLAAHLVVLAKVRGDLAHRGIFDPKKGNELILPLLFRISCLLNNAERVTAGGEAEELISSQEA